MRGREKTCLPNSARRNGIILRFCTVHFKSASSRSTYAVTLRGDSLRCPHNNQFEPYRKAVWYRSDLGLRTGQECGSGSGYYPICLYCVRRDDTRLHNAPTLSPGKTRTDTHHSCASVTTVALTNLTTTVFVQRKSVLYWRSSSSVRVSLHPKACRE